MSPSHRASTVKNHYLTLGMSATLEPCFVFQYEAGFLQMPKAPHPHLPAVAEPAREEQQKRTHLSFRKAEVRTLLCTLNIPEEEVAIEKGQGVRAEAVGGGAGSGGQQGGSSDWRRRQEKVRRDTWRSVLRLHPQCSSTWHSWAGHPVTL